MKNRIFVDYLEAANLLETDAEGLRQQLASRQITAPGFVRIDPPYTVAYLHGAYLKREGDASEMRLAELIDGTVFRGAGSASNCDWDEQETHRSRTGFGSVYELRGYFRICEGLSGYAREGRLGGLAVAPEEWFEERSTYGIDSYGWPNLHFGLLSVKYGNYADPPVDLERLHFRVQDISPSSNSDPTARKEQQSTGGLRTDAIQSYERVIAALWAKAHGDGGAGTLSDKPTTAADSLSRLLDKHNLPTPSKDKIARILAASKKQGLKIGS